MELHLKHAEPKVELVSAPEIRRELPDTLGECHAKIVRLEDAVQRETERAWNLLDRMRDKALKEWVAENRHKAMVGRILTQIPLEWVRKYIYDTDQEYTTVHRSTLEDVLDGNSEGEY